MDLASAFALGVFAASSDKIRPIVLGIVPFLGFVWYEARRTASEFCQVRPKAPVKTFRRPVPAAPVNSPVQDRQDRQHSSPGPYGDSYSSDRNRPESIQKELAASEDS